MLKYLMMENIFVHGLNTGGKKMTGLVIQKEKNRKYRRLMKEYLKEGYDKTQAKRLAKQETDDEMSLEEDMYNKLYRNALKDLD